MHISDVHIDFFYTIGGPAKCDEPVCCRMNVTAKPNSPKAGKWGSPVGDCDLPIQTFNLFLEQVSKMNIDFILWTGDNTAHDIWQQNQAYNNNFTMIISDLLKKKLTQNVYPSSGNH
jgi:sphingomyelin phosphodiesterase